MKEIQFQNLEYVVIKTKKNSLPFEKLQKISEDVTVDILQNRPIRGKELFFLRNVLQLSYSKLSVAMNGALDSSTISRLEKKEDVRLSPVNEVFFRELFAEKLNVNLSVSSIRLLSINHVDVVKVTV